MTEQTPRNDLSASIADRDYWNKVGEVVGLRVRGWSYRHVADLHGDQRGQQIECPAWLAERLLATADRIERLEDKVEGLTADLESAVEVAYRRGATEWTRLNYPDLFARLEATAALKGQEG